MSLEKVWLLPFSLGCRSPSLTFSRAFTATVSPKVNKKDASFMFERPRRKSAGTLEKVSSLLKLKKLSKRSNRG